jgi:S-DNA-T family DNA segregation ATPase FtsK/SpoIIIE
MSVQRPGSEGQRLLSPAVEHSVNELAIRLCGGALVAFAASAWLALISWQLRDGGRAARNLLGNFGAGLSDMLVTTVGIAAIFVVICPMIWGMELLAGMRWIERFRLKIVAAVVGALCLAGFTSGLPALPGWPLPGGVGGMLGDLVHNIASTALARLELIRGNTPTTLFLLLCGSFLILFALGMRLEHLLALHRIRAQPAPAPAAVATTAPAPAPAAAEPPRTPARSAVEPALEPMFGPALELPPAPRSLAHQHRAAGPRSSHHETGIPDQYDFDSEHDASARAFAERFAPGVATGKPTARPRGLGPLQAPLGRTRNESRAWRKPSLNLLRRGPGPQQHAHADITTGATQLVEVLSSFGVKGEIREVRPGPVVTRYELEPVRGTKLARVIGLADDFARELGATSVRVSTTPGRSTIGIEIPNDIRKTVVLRDILETDTFTAPHMQLPLALGKGIAGEPVVLDLARMPHLLVAGTTGSGKSVGLNAMILSLVYRLDPSELRLLLIDPKMLEMSQYDRIPHLLSPVITDPAEAAQALEWAVSEMEERYRRMAQQSTRNIETFNAKVRTALTTGSALTRTVHTGFDTATGRAIYERQQLDDKPMPYIVIVIDELADLMIMAGKKIEGSVQRLAQKARAAGIHLVMATQRPSVDVVTGTIKANFPVRISFRVASRIDSRTILNEPGAELLLGHGDMLLTSGSSNHLRIHGAYVADDEIERVTEALREQGEPAYVELLARPPAAPKAATAPVRRDPAPLTPPVAPTAPADEHYATAVAIVSTDRKVSPGHLHRRMGIAEPVAAGLIARMEADGFVGPVNMLGRREIRIPAPARKPNAGRTAA